MAANNAIAVYRRWWSNKQTCWEPINLMPVCMCALCASAICLFCYCDARLFCFCMQNYFIIIMIVPRPSNGIRISCARIPVYGEKGLELLTEANVRYPYRREWTRQASTYSFVRWKSKINFAVQRFRLFAAIISKIQSRNMTANRIYQTKQVVHSSRHRITAKTDSWIRRQYVDYAFHFESSSLFFVCALCIAFLRAALSHVCARAANEWIYEIDEKSVSVALFQSIFRAEKLLFH